jgi:hypothetical protein
MTTTDPPAIESLTPEDGEVDRRSTAQEWTAWAMRGRLPSELTHKAALRFPQDASVLAGLPEDTLRKLRAGGDHPRLYAIGRALFTTKADLQAWLEAHELTAGQTIRPATVPRGTKLAPPVARGQKRKPYPVAAAREVAP